MTDYGHDLLFGSFITPSAADPDGVVALAQLTEQVGLDLVTVQDHPYQARHLDTWTLLSVIAARTSRVRVAPNVANLPLRQPVVLARSVASLDRLTGGRVELGLGAGSFRDAIAAIGGPRLTTRESIDALEEGIGVIRAIWNTDARSVRLDGRHYRVKGAHPGPAPAHDVGIWLGAYKPRMLGLTGRLADGWLPSSPYAPPDQLPAMNRAIDAASEEAGRDPASIRRLYNITGSFRATGDAFLDGPAGLWAAQLAELALEHGMSGFIVMGDDPEVLRRFAGDVVPAVRELVATARSGAGGLRATPAPVEAVATGPGRGFTITPTPDDGRRLSAETVWDESTRPTAGPADGERTYTAREQATGQHLIDVHDHLRAELRQLRDLVAQVTTGAVDAGRARSHINTMTMRQNNWTVGAYCESYCRFVTTHHTLEDQSLFPHLRRVDPSLRPVIDRLEEEHVAIHDVLDRLDRALVAFVTDTDTDTDGAKALTAAVDLLTDTLVSHLSYEERELVDPLARHGLY
jgi:alkanesulfonate monooxygenase SsuD/methylene tetrahydromethanopterin reductase-like flavin-dependent oxidoreductase (luciferase family)